MSATEQKTQTWWRANKMSATGEIEALGVVRATAKTVYYTTPNRHTPLCELKVTTWGEWFDNEEDAIRFQRGRLVNTVVRMRGGLAAAEKALAAFNAEHPED